MLAQQGTQFRPGRSFLGDAVPAPGCSVAPTPTWNGSRRSVAVCRAEVGDVLWWRRSNAGKQQITIAAWFNNSLVRPGLVEQPCNERYVWDQNHAQTGGLNPCGVGVRICQSPRVSA